MPKVHREGQAERYATMCEQLIAGMSTTNSPDARRFYTHRQRRCAPSTSYMVLASVARAVEHFNGASLRTVTPEQWDDFLNARGRRLSISTLKATGARLRFYLRQTLDVDTLPRALRQSLGFRQKAPVKDVQIGRAHV